jgi:hypothetical protein
MFTVPSDHVRQMQAFQRLNRDSEMFHVAAAAVQLTILNHIRPEPAEAAAGLIREILDEGPADADAMGRVFQMILNAHQASLADRAMEEGQ